MRMRNFRILPAAVVNNVCPLDRVTRNMALGSTSATTPSTSIASSFMMLLEYQDVSTLSRHSVVCAWSIGFLSARVLGPQAFRRLGFDLARFTRLHIVPTAAELAKDPRFLHLAFERLQRPIDAVGLAEVHLRHVLCTS